MEDKNNNWHEKEVSFAQSSLALKLLQSHHWSKKEFEEFSKVWFTVIKSSFKASIFIDMLLKTLKFRDKVSLGKRGANLKCKFCGSNKYIDRYLNLETWKQSLVCAACFDKREEARQEAVLILAEEAKVRKDRIEEMSEEIEEAAKAASSTVDEKREASADLFRKYEF